MQLANAVARKSYREAASVDARGNVTEQSLGNSVSEARSYDPIIGNDGVHNTIVLSESALNIIEDSAGF